MSARFDACLSVVLPLEGGLVDRKSDRGGRTNQGITQSVYDAWREGQGSTARDVALIENAEVREIYEDLYWRPVRCDDLPPPLDLYIFDMAVNQGPYFAGRALQEALKMPVLDGLVGPKTIAAVAGADLNNLLARVALRRLTRYIVTSELDGQAVNLRGWLHRLGGLLLRA